MPTTTTKQVHGKSYLYFTYYDSVDKKKKESYCGLENDPKSALKAMELEQDYLKKRTMELTLEIRDMERKMIELNKMNKKILKNI